MTPFTAAANLAVDALFACFGEAATYTPDGGAPVEVIVIRSRRDPVIHFGFSHGPGVRSPGWSMVLRQSDVPVRPHSESARVMIGAKSFLVMDAEEDEARLFWSCDVVS